MNKLLKVFAVTLMMVLGGQAMAQTRGAMFLGASFPMSDFADFDGFDDFALTSYELDDDDAGAGIGFNAGLKWYFNVGVPGLGVMLSVDGLYNGPCQDLKNWYRTSEGSFNGGSLNYTAKPQYINIPAMLGLNYIYRINPNLGVYVEAGAGGNLRFITKMESVNKMDVIQTTRIQEYDKAFSFAYQAGIGIEVAKNLIIGCSFYDLGKASVAGEETVKVRNLEENVSNAETHFNEFGTVHPIMVLGRIGFCF
jgi:opacity protein-like surface antigen